MVEEALIITIHLLFTALVAVTIIAFALIIAIAVALAVLIAINHKREKNYNDLIEEIFTDVSGSNFKFEYVIQRIIW